MKTHSITKLIYILLPILLGPASVSPGQQVAGWGHYAVNAWAAREITRGEGVKVGILDTGVQKNHPDLQGNIIGGINLVKKAGNSTRWDDDHGHGTQMAVTIAAVDNTIGTLGIAPAAKLFVVKVLPKDFYTKPSQIDPKVVADGIYACMANGVHVINMSFGIAVDAPVLHNAIIAAHNAGIVLVASVGENSSPNVLYPAKYPEVIAVTTLIQMSYNNFALAGNSNWGPEVDFAAPGGGFTAYFSGGGTYTMNGGMGNSAAHVTGVAALMLSAGKTDLVARDVTPDPLTPEQRGHGLIDAYLTVTAE